ncbi:MAG: cation:proton antiporter [Kiritimatiellae bacterium]|nr:cation:proton antiporter [Kiritimatiellia bacterium]
MSLFDRVLPEGGAAEGGRGGLLRKSWVFLLIALVAALPAVAAEEAVSAGEKLTHQMMFLVFQIGMILFVAKLGGMFASCCKLPSVLGELASGVLIGPYALGGFGFGNGLFKNGVFPFPADASIPVTPELYGICTIASVILLFLSGLETDLKLFLRYSVAGSFIGVGGVVASFLFGDLCAVYLMPHFLPHFAGIGFLHPASLFMGIMCTATSVGITARILSERKAMDSAEGVTIMAGAVIDDVLGIIVLAVGMGIIGTEKAASSGGVNWRAISEIAVQAFGIWLGGTILGIVLARRISWLLKLFRTPVAVATLAFGLSLIVAGLFEAMGLSLIIGAYVMGLALSRTDIRYLIQENLQSVYTFLVPVFFCVMGMMVDCSQILSKNVLIFGGVFTLLAILAKIIGCSFPALFCGFNSLGSLRIGAGMIPRGEVALIIAGIGLSSGYLTKDVFGIGILMTLVTTIVAPPLLVAFFNVKRPGVRNPQAGAGEGTPIAVKLPNGTPVGLILRNLVTAFRHEGFFTSLLNPEEDIWRLTKNDIDISCRRGESEILFECAPKHAGVVETAVQEVIAQLNAMARDLPHPVQLRQLNAMVQTSAEHLAEDERTREITRYLRRFEMFPALDVSSFNELVETITAKMAEDGLIQDLDAARKSIFERESAMGTGLKHGLGAPHGRTGAVAGLVGAVAVIKTPEKLGDYKTMEGLPVSLVILTIASDSGATPHLQLMAYMSRLLRSPEVSEGLRQCDSPDAMREYILSGGKSVPKVAK